MHGSCTCVVSVSVVHTLMFGGVRQAKRRCGNGFVRRSQQQNHALNLGCLFDGCNVKRYWLWILLRLVSLQISREKSYHHLFPRQLVTTNIKSTHYFIVRTFQKEKTIRP